MQYNIQPLIDYRIEQANQTIKEIQILIENELLTIAINRIYYGMFYMLLALSLKEGFKTSKHVQLIGWFNKEFVRTGKTSVSIGKIVNKAYENRTDGDYGMFVNFERDEVKQRFQDMILFIAEIEKLIKQ